MESTTLLALAAAAHRTFPVVFVGFARAIEVARGVTLAESQPAAAPADAVELPDDCVLRVRIRVFVCEQGAACGWVLIWHKFVLGLHLC